MSFHLKSLAITLITLGSFIPAWSFPNPPTTDAMFDFARKWRTAGYMATDLLKLIQGSSNTTPTPTASRTPSALNTMTRTRTRTHTATPTMTRTMTRTPTRTGTQTGQPVLNSISPRVVNVGDSVTLTGSNLGNGSVQIDVGGTVVTGNATGNAATFNMPSVQGMTYILHCVEVRLIAPGNKVSNPVGLVYPKKHDQADDTTLIITDSRYTSATRRFEIDAAVKNQKVANGKPLCLSSPAVIILDATGVPTIATGILANNDSRNPFISAHPHWDYRFAEPVFSSPAHRLESGQTTTPRTWILLAESPDTHAFSLDLYITDLCQPTKIHAADIFSTPSLRPHPFGLGYDPVTHLLHVSGDFDGWLYGVDVDAVDQMVAKIIQPEKGPSYVEVSPQGADPGHANGRIWWSWTHPELITTENVIGVFDAKNFVASSEINNVEQAYVVLPTGLDLAEPRGLAFDAATGYLYAAEADKVYQILIGVNPVSPIQLDGFTDIQGLSVDPANGNLFIVERGTSRVHRIKGLRSQQVTEQVTFGGPGSAIGKFNDPRGIEVDEDGIVFVVDRGNDRVQVLDGRTPAIDWLMMFGGHIAARTIVGCEGPNTICPIVPGDGFDKPGDVESIDKRTIWVSDTDNGRIIRFIHDSYDEDTFPFKKAGHSSRIRSKESTWRGEVLPGIED